MPKSTAQELIGTPDRLVRFWVALLSACMVFGAFSARLSFNDAQLQQDLIQVVQAQAMLTEQLNQNAIAQAEISTRVGAEHDNVTTQLSILRSDVSGLRAQIMEIIREK